MSKIGRNERCPCGSGKKFKRCCLRDQPRDATGPSSLEPEPWLDDLALDDLLRAPDGWSAGELWHDGEDPTADPGLLVDIEWMPAEIAHELGLGQHPLRSFEVVEAVPGHGLWVVETDGESPSAERQFVDDECASFVFEPGCLFIAGIPPGAPIQIPPLWMSCPCCLEKVEEGRKAVAHAH